MEKWEGLVAVVTGASSGIGRAIATSLAEHGMIVAAIARREEKLKDLANNFKGKGKIIAVKGDITEEEEIEKVLRNVEKSIGQIRVLVNNAGVLMNTALTDFDLKAWRTMFDTNLMGLAACTKYVVQSAIKNKGGQVHVINVNSLAGHEVVNYKNVFVYCMTKHCVTMLTRQLIKTYPKDNIRFTSLSPGVVETELFVTSGIELDPSLVFLSPQDVAEAAIIALSAHSHVVLSEVTVKPLGELL